MPKKPTPVDAGNYYGRTYDGRLVLLGDVARKPDHVICRRVDDFPDGRPPNGAKLQPCAQCQEFIAFNPKGLHLDRPRICLQCAGVQPLPIED